jgi:hypothetical protein
MPKRAASFATIVSAALLAAMAFGRPVLAAGTCIEQPNQQATDGAHWYYHVDRTNNRKCWYLAAVRMREPETPMPERTPDVAPQPILSTLFASLFGGLTGAPAAAARQDLAREPRIIQASPTKPLRLDDIVQKEPKSFPEELADQQNPPPLKRTKRDALFQKFLRWDENQRNSGAGPSADLHGGK